MVKLKKTNSNQAGNFLKKLAATLILAAVGVIVALLIGELVVFALFRRKIVFFPRYVTNVSYNDFEIRRNVPNARYRHKSIDGQWEFRINSRGFRNDKDFNYKKTPGVLRILTVGDSFTIGYEVGQDETFSAVIEKRLALKGVQAEVINAGVSGFGTAEELLFLEQEGMKYQPDIVIIGFFYNDYVDNVRSDLYRLDGNGELVLNKKKYAPATDARNFLNSIFIYRWLSERSYLLNYINQALTGLLKKRMERVNEKDIETELEAGMPDYNRQLALKLIGEMHGVARENGAFFILLDIARRKGSGDLERSLDLDPQTMAQISDYYLDSLELIVDHDVDEIYRPHGHRHWSPLSHSIVGENLGDIIYDVSYSRVISEDKN